MTTLTLGDVVTIACTGELFVGEVVGFFSLPDGIAFVTSARRNGRRLGSYMDREGVKWLPGRVTADSQVGMALLAAEEAAPAPVEHVRLNYATGEITPYDDAN